MTTNVNNNFMLQSIYVCDWWSDCLQDEECYEIWESGQNHMALAELDTAKDMCVLDIYTLMLNDLNHNFETINTLNWDVEQFKDAISFEIGTGYQDEQDIELRTRLSRYHFWEPVWGITSTSVLDDEPKEWELTYPGDHIGDVWTIRRIVLA